MKKKVISSLVLGMLLVILANTAVFAETGIIDFKARDIVENPVDFIEVKFYRVAKVEVPYTYVEDAFNSFDIEDASEANIKAMAEYATNNVEPVLTKTTDQQGNFTVELETGKYLIVQSNREDDCDMQTMYISLPEITENSINYTITVKPKIDVQYGIGGDDLDLSGRLPQTGIIDLPIVILGVSGAAIFCIAWILFYTKKKVR